MDAQVLAAMVERGANLSNRRTIRHYLYGDSEAALRDAIDRLASEGYTVEVQPAGSGDWLALAERQEFVNLVSVATARRFFDHVASGVPGGHYDGWQAHIVER